MHGVPVGRAFYDAMHWALQDTPLSRVRHEYIEDQYQAYLSATLYHEAFTPGVHT